jgi:5-methylthioribose kinase
MFLHYAFFLQASYQTRRFFNNIASQALIEYESTQRDLLKTDLSQTVVSQPTLFSTNMSQVVKKNRKEELKEEAIKNNIRIMSKKSRPNFLFL